MKKRAIAYIGGPRQLQDFIWYYLANGKDYVWDLVCQPMYKEMGLETVCRQSGLFEEIYMPDSFLSRSKKELVKIGATMGLYWLFGKSKQYAKKEIAKFMDMNRYEHMCLSTVRGVTCGMMALAADDSISIDLMEDGYGDNTDAHAKLELYRLKEPFYLVAYFFAKMGYCNPNGLFPLKSTKKCCRYSAKPETLSKELYKEVRLLGDMSCVNAGEYDDLMRKTFGELEDYSNAQAILYTTAMKDFSEDYLYYIDLACKYLADKEYTEVAVKRHPRDQEDYVIQGCDVISLNPQIPGEIIAKNLCNQEIYLMFPSSTLDAFEDSEKSVNIFEFTGLADQAYYTSSFSNAIQTVRKIRGLSVNIIKL